MGSKGLGELGKFNPRIDIFQAYVERTILFFEANSISENKHLQINGTVIGTLDVDQYLLPKRTDLFATLAEGQTWTSLKPTSSCC